MCRWPILVFLCLALVPYGLSWEVRLYEVRSSIALPKSGEIPQSIFDELRSPCPIATFRLAEGESASYRLYEPALTFKLTMAPRPGGGASFSLSVVDHRASPSPEGTSTVRHLTDFLYLLRPLKSFPVLVQLSP